jgi:hypothetical protein
MHIESFQIKAAKNRAVEIRQFGRFLFPFFLHCYGPPLRRKPCAPALRSNLPEKNRVKLNEMKAGKSRVLKLRRKKQGSLKRGFSGVLQGFIG